MDQEGRGQFITRLKLAEVIKCVGIPLEILESVETGEVGCSCARPASTSRSLVGKAEQSRKQVGRYQSVFYGLHCKQLQL